MNGCSRSRPDLWKHVFVFIVGPKTHERWRKTNCVTTMILNFSWYCGEQSSQISKMIVSHGEKGRVLSVNYKYLPLTHLQLKVCHYSCLITCGKSHMQSIKWGFIHWILILIILHCFMYYSIFLLVVRTSPEASQSQVSSHVKVSSVWLHNQFKS